MPHLQELASSLRSLTLIESSGKRAPRQTRAANAAKLAQKAGQRGDRKAQSYWRSVYANAKAKLLRAAGRTAEPEGTPAKKTAPAAAGGAGHAKKGKDEPKQSLRSRMLGLLKKSATAASTALKKLPKDVQKLATNPTYRASMGRKLATHIKRIPAKVLLHAIEEVSEVVKAGAVLVKAASGKDLDHKDKHALKAGAKALATTVLGTVVMGGIAHLTVNALAQHFATETAMKSVGKAALFAAAVAVAEEKKAMLRAWAEDVMDAVHIGFATMGTMTDEDIVKAFTPEEDEEDGK